MTVHRSGERVRCGSEKCPRFIGIVQNNRLFVKNGDQMVITQNCSVVCKCGYVNHVVLRESTDNHS